VTRTATADPSPSAAGAPATAITRRALGPRAARLAGAGALGLAGGPSALAACGPPAGAPGAGTLALYVADARDGTIDRLDAATGYPLGPPLPAGPAPGQIVPGPAGSLLVRSLDAERGHPLTLVRRVGGVWSARPLSLGPGTRVALVAVAGAGAGAAVAAYSGGPGPSDAGCRLVHILLPAGTVAAAHPACAPEETVTALAAADPADAGTGGAAVYVGVWRPDPPPAGAGGGLRGRVLAVDGGTGAVRRALPLPGAPVDLALAPAPDGRGARLYCLEVAPGGTNEALARADPVYTADDRWRLHGLDPDGLTPEVTWPLAGPAHGLAVAPDGARAYLLAGAAPAGALWQVDLATGAADRLAALPASGEGVAVTAERVYVSNPHWRDVWAVDRRRGGAPRAIRVGRAPAGLSLGPAG
jgi:DNA-binding beta-propeller fold protein YncE